MVNGAVNGSTAGGALNKAARLTSAKNDAWDTAGLVLGVAGVALFVAALGWLGLWLLKRGLIVRGTAGLPGISTPAL